MYHSVTFTLPNVWSKNSYDDFHLVPDGRPVISMPEPVTNYLEVPGASGQLDMSTSLTGYPLYGAREGSLSFIVLNDYSGADSWIRRHDTIVKFIHGRRLELYLEDDPDYFYEGRFKVDSWESPSDGGNSTVSIGYTLDSYKYWQQKVQSTINLSGNSSTLRFSGIRGNLGTMPTVPTIEVLNATNNITITASNPSIYSGTFSHVVSRAATYQFQDIVFMDLDGNNECSLSISGSGTVKVTLQNGDL